jgi:hypothetical protein
MKLGGYMKELYSLFSNEITVGTTKIKGELKILGNIEENWMRLIFYFDESTQKVPLIIQISDGNDKFDYLCSPDKNENTVCSSMFEPEFLMSKGFNVVNIKPLVTMEI